MATRLARHHAQNVRVGKPQPGLNHCARCGDLVPHDSDHLRAQLQGLAVVLHWCCFAALMRGHGNTPGQYISLNAAANHACHASQDPRMRDRAAATDEMMSVHEVTDN